MSISKHLQALVSNGRQWSAMETELSFSEHQQASASVAKQWYAMASNGYGAKPH